MTMTSFILFWALILAGAIAWRWRRHLSGGLVVPADRFILCREASLSGSAHRRLLDVDQDHNASLNGVLATAAALPPGAWLLGPQVVLGHAHGFGAEVRARVDAIESGQPTRSPSPLPGLILRLWRPAAEAGAVAAVVLWISGSIHIAGGLFLVGLVWGVFRSNGRDAASTSAPAPAIKKTRVSSDLSKEMLAKAEADVHAAVDLRIAVCGAAEDEGLLRSVLDQTQAALGWISTAEQQLVWCEVEPAAALTGLLREQRTEQSLVVDAAELAAIARPADRFVQAQSVEVARSRVEILPDRQFPVIADPLHPDGLVPIGIINAQGENPLIIGQPASALDTDKALAGTAGSGKSEGMKWDVTSSASAGYPIVLIDPQGPTAEETLVELIRWVPERFDDLLLIDLADREFALAINPLDVREREQVEAAISDLATIVEKQLGFSEAGTPRALRLVTLALKALAGANLFIAEPSSKLCLAQVVDFFADAEFRHTVVSFSRELGYREVLDWFAPGTGAFDAKPKEASTLIQPILTRFGDLLSQDTFARMFSAPLNAVDFPVLAAEGKIVIINLQRDGGVNPRAGLFFATWVPAQLVRGVKIFGRRRDPVTHEDTGGRGLRLVVDEAASVMTPAIIEVIGKQFRKWGFGQILGFQDVSDFETGAANSLLNITGTIAALRGGVKASGPMAREISPSGQISAADIANQNKFHAFMKASLGNSEQEVASVFSVDLLPPHESFDPRWQAMTDNEKRAEHARVAVLVEEVRDRTRKLICNPVAPIRGETGAITNPGIDARRQLLPDDNAGVARTAMTELSLREMQRLISERASS